VSELRSLVELSRAYLLQTVRSKTALFWTLGFPQVWLFAFALLFGDGTPEGVTRVLPHVLVLTIFAGSFFGVSYTMVNERENGILRRYRVTPVSALTLVLANGVRSVANVGTSVVLQIVLAMLIFGARVPSPGGLFVAVAAGIVAFVPLGLILGAVAKDMRSAPALGNLIFFPMMFLSGAAVPFEWLPEWMHPIARMLPATYLTDAIQGVMVREEAILAQWGPLTAMVVSGAAAAVADALLFRWESDDPLDMRRVTAALGVLLLAWGSTAVAAPPLRMGMPPGAEAMARGIEGGSGEIDDGPDSTGRDPGSVEAGAGGVERDPGGAEAGSGDTDSGAGIRR